MLKIAIIITVISIGLLLIYGIDVAVSKESNQGFIPFDHKIRGMALGGPAMVLPIIGFFISRKKQSKSLAVMLIVSGILIMIGGAAFLSMSPSEVENTRNAMTEAGPLFAVGAFQIALGAIKIRK